MTKLPNHEPNARLVTPFRVDAAYESSPGRISTVTVPPSAALILPAWTAAVQTELSSV